MSNTQPVYGYEVEIKSDVPEKILEVIAYIPEEEMASDDFTVLFLTFSDALKELAKDKGIKNANTTVNFLTENAKAFKEDKVAIQFSFIAGES